MAPFTSGQANAAAHDSHRHRRPWAPTTILSCVCRVRVLSRHWLSALRRTRPGPSAAPCGAAASSPSLVAALSRPYPPLFFVPSPFTPPDRKMLPKLHSPLLTFPHENQPSKDPKASLSTPCYPFVHPHHRRPPSLDEFEAATADNHPSW
jgi:hypothetical protein